MRNRVGPYFAALQLFFTLSWTAYVIFLPRLAAQIGIAKQWIVWTPNQARRSRQCRVVEVAWFAGLDCLGEIYRAR